MVTTAGNKIEIEMDQEERARVIIESCKKSAIRGMEQFLRNFSHVPDDKLNWSVTPTAKSAIRIAAHTAVTQANFAKMIRERRLPTAEELPDFIARTKAAEIALTDRTEMEKVFRKNTDDVLAALDTLPPEAIDIRLESSQGWSMPISFLLNLPCSHADWHTGQIDFLQTCWGDQEIYVN